MSSRKNRFYTENPYYTLFIRPRLGADDEDIPDDNPSQEGDGACYYDPVTKKIECNVKKSPQPVPQPTPMPRLPDPPYPDDEPPQPTPEPTEDQTKAHILRALGQFFARGLTQKAPNLPGPDVTPSYFSSRQPLLAPPVEILPRREAPQNPGTMNDTQRQTSLRSMQEASDERVQQALSRNQQAAQGRPDLIKGLLADASQRVQEIQSAQHTTPQDYMPVVDAVSQQGFQQLLEPGSNAMPFIADVQPANDYRQFVQRPVSNAAYLQGLQARELARQNAEAQQQLLQEQIRLAQTQRKAAQLHQLATKKQKQRQQHTQSKAKSTPPKTPPDPEKLYWQARQQLLITLFGKGIFTQTELQYPFDLNNGKRVPDRNIIRLIAISNWILFRKSKQEWTSQELQYIPSLLNGLTSEQEHQFELAKKLHLILKNNEESKNKNDALALTKGFESIIQENTLNGTVNEKQVMRDLRFFFIDQRTDLTGIIAYPLHRFGASNAAYNLFGGPRIGVLGWKPAYVDSLRPSSNQAHHFAAFFIAGFETPEKGPAHLEAILLDGGISIKGKTIVRKNRNDIKLSDRAIQLGYAVRNRSILWLDLPREIYRNIHESGLN